MLRRLYRLSPGRSFQVIAAIATSVLGCHGTSTPNHAADAAANTSGTTTAGTSGGNGADARVTDSAPFDQSTGPDARSDVAATTTTTTTGGLDGAPDVLDSGQRSDAARTDAAIEAGASTVVRTFVYHQITARTDTKQNPTAPPVLSADGRRIAFTVSPGSEDPATPNKIYVMNSDGSGLKEVDSYTTGCFCGSSLSISGDGSTIVSTDAVNLRVVTSDGVLKGNLTLGGNSIWGRPVISGDGSHIAFVIDRDSTIASLGNMPAQRGVWVMSADGTGLKQLAGPDAVIGIVGGKVDDVFPFRLCGQNLALSADGTRVAFGTWVNGLGDTLFGIGFDGSALHKILGPIAPPAGSSLSVYRITLSGDGKTIAYRQIDPAGDSFLATVGFDGTVGKTFAKSPPTFFGGACNSDIGLTADGSQALLSETGVLIPTLGTGDHITLEPAVGYYSSDPNGIGTSCCGPSPNFSMTGDGKRFSFQNVENAGLPVQLGMLELDPASLGEAPAVSTPSIFPQEIPRDRSVGATVSAKVTGSGVVRVGTAVMLRGDADVTGSWIAGSLVLLDDGKAPDTTSADGVYAGGAITAGSGAELGGRLVRIKAETKAADGRRHATAIEVTGLAVK